MRQAQISQIFVKGDAFIINYQSARGIKTMIPRAFFLELFPGLSIIYNTPQPPISHGKHTRFKNQDFHMIITTKSGQSFDTEKDLTAAERHILQKLFAWEALATSLEQFKEKRKEAAIKGWNNSGPVKESNAFKAIVRDMKKKVIARLDRE